MSDNTPDGGDTLEYRSDGDAYRVEFSDSTDEPSTTIVKAIAAIVGCKQDDLDPLYYVIEPGALDSIFQPTVRGDHQGDVEISFTYNGFHVSVRSYGIVEIQPTDSTPTPDEGSSR